MFQMYSVQCWEEESMTFWKGSHDIVKLSWYLPGQTEAIHKEVITAGAQVENRTGHILSTSLKCSSLEKNQWPMSRIEPDTSWVQVWSVQTWKKKVTVTQIENRTEHILSRSLKLSSLEKNSQWLRLLNFRLVFLLNNMHFLRPSQTYSSNLPFALKCYTHLSPNAGLWL